MTPSSFVSCSCASNAESMPQSQISERSDGCAFETKEIHVRHEFSSYLLAAKWKECFIWKRDVSGKALEFKNDESSMRSTVICDR